MSKPLGEIESIQETMADQFRKTMNVVHAIKGNTEELLNKTERVIKILGDEEDKAEPEPLAEAEIEAEVEEILAETAVELARQEAAINSDIIDAVTVPDPRLVAHITKACVKEVMATINPVLEALNKFIKANAIDKKTAPEVDDDAFAEKLIEEMKLSLGRRQRIALARKRMTSP